MAPCCLSLTVGAKYRDISVSDAVCARPVTSGVRGNAEIPVV